jgi:cardiolipin synthase
VPEYVSGNSLTLLHNGGEYFPSLVAAIDGARHEIFLESYIFADDRTGHAVATALARAAARGVAAHVLLDAFGCKSSAPQLDKELRGGGVEVLFFRPQVSPWPPWKQRTRLRRMHRKLACIDNEVAFVGGINIIDDHETPKADMPRFDYAVKIEGPLVAQVRFEAEKLWSQVSWATHGRREPVPRGPREVPKALGKDQRAALVVRDNRHHRRDIELAYLERIDAARKDIIIACAYFFPGRRFRQALSRAARRGVRVTLLMQGRIEYALAYYASLALYGTMLGAGVRIYEYHRSFLHAKAAVFDNEAACVGSSNIDPFSLLLAREANVFVEDRRFATELRQSLEQEMRDGARRVPRSSWKEMPLWRRLAMWLAFRGARWLMGFYGYDRQH